MAYADLGTFTPGDILTAATMSQARDNDEFLIDPPQCSVYHDTTQSIATASLTVLNANSENYDSDSMHSTSVNNSRITIQTDGRYLFIAEMLFPSNATGNRGGQFYLNATSQLSGHLGPAAAATTGTNVQLVRSIVCTAGDYIEVRAFQSSGGALNVTLEEFAAKFISR